MLAFLCLGDRHYSIRVVSRRAGVILLLLLSGALRSQSIELRSSVAAGGFGIGGGPSLSWTVGQPAGRSFSGPSQLVTAGVQQPEGVMLALNIKVLLDGPYKASQLLMIDNLRTLGLLPLSEPYSAMGFAHAGLGGGESMVPSVLAVQGPDAIVDWVMLELRDALSPTTVVSTRAALVQRDGDVVDRDGNSPVRISAMPGSYYLALHHRNHLPVMTAATLPLSQAPTPIDLVNGSIITHGADAQRQRDGVLLLWGGDVNGDGEVRYVGTNNDRDFVLVAIGGVFPTASAAGYLQEDVTLDGMVKYLGANNDRDIMLQTIGGATPTVIRYQQMP